MNAIGIIFLPKISLADFAERQNLTDKHRCLHVKQLSYEPNLREQE